MITAAGIWTGGVNTFAWFCLFVILDWIITRMRFISPYYCVHTIHNALIVVATYADVWATFTDFPRLSQYPANLGALQLCFALHFYHVAVYYRKFRYDDWLHHILMIAVALPIGGLLPSSTLLGFSLFFTTGVPGGIDYALLFAVRNGWIHRMTEKNINCALNIWVRSPGCCAQAAFTTVYILSQYDTLGSSYIVGLALLPAFLNYWNGQYFMQQVVWDTCINSSRSVQRPTD